MTANIECSVKIDALLKGLDPYCTDHSEEYCEMVLDWSDCHSEYVDAPAKDDLPHGPVFYKEMYRNSHDRLRYDQRGFEATRDEVKGLYEGLLLRSAQIMCIEFDCPRILGRTSDGSDIYSSGVFHFETDLVELERMIDMLEHDEIEINSISEDRREALIEHLETLLETYFEEMFGKKGAEEDIWR